MRVTEHPIINEFPKGRLVTFEYDGKPMEGYEGEPIAMALKSNGVEIHRYTTKLHKPRGLYCSSADAPIASWLWTEFPMSVPA